MPSKYLSLCHPLLVLPSIFPSIRVFSIRVSSNELALPIMWPKNWSFSCSISLSKQYSGFIAFRIDWFDLLAVQGILKSSPAPQFESINSTVLSLLYDPTLTSIHDYCKSHITLTIRTFFSKVLSLHFTMLFQFSSVQSLSHVQLCATP